MEQTLVIMPRRGRMGLHPVISTKHVVDTAGELASGARSTVTIALEKPVRSSPFNPAEVVLASHVKNIFLSIFIIGATGAPLNGAIDWYIAKRRSGQTKSADFPDPGETGISDIRNQIFHEEKGLAGSGDGTPMAFKGVIKVPEHMRRTRSNDEFFILLKSVDPTNNATFCVKAIYKEFQWLVYYTWLKGCMSSFGYSYIITKKSLEHDKFYF